MESSDKNIFDILKTSNQPLIDALKYRRTIRNFDITYKIPDEDLKKILDAGQNAPTTSNIQSIDFVVIKNQKMLTEVSEKILKNLPKDAQDHFDQRKENEISNTITCDASVVVLLIKNEREKCDKHFDVGVGTALMAMMIASLQFGLDTMCIGMLKNPIVEEYFKLPKDSIGLALAIGKSKEKREYPHKDIKNKVTYIE